MRLFKRAALVACALYALSVHISAHEPALTPIDRGAAAYYAPSYDYGGWQSIIAKRIAWGQHDPATFPYSDAGYYCVRPGFVFGNVLTLTNARTGKTILCTIADTNAPQDNAVWWSRWVVETSYTAFVALGLQDGNEVVVSAVR